MSSNFDRWEKDPFFSAAEEVQESADRMESTYRTWIHSKKDSSTGWNPEEIRRDLHTTLGTTKWQLEELERAVTTSYTNSSADDARDRHRDFIVAIANQISKVENSLHESSPGKPPLPWVRLDEGECNELALFLSGPSDQSFTKTNEGKQHSIDELKSSEEHSKEWPQMEASESKLPGHRRTASASADIGAWNIAVGDHGFANGTSDANPEPPPRKIPSFSGFLNTMEYASKFKWPKNGYRKVKLMDHHEEVDSTVSRSQHLARGMNACYERSKSCLEGCDECYDKQLNGWYGSIQRQLQRSQYHMRYGRSTQYAIWVFLLLCLVVLFALRAI